MPNLDTKVNVTRRKTQMKDDPLEFIQDEAVL